MLKLACPYSSHVLPQTIVDACGSGVVKPRTSHLLASAHRRHLVTNYYATVRADMTSASGRWASLIVGLCASIMSNIVIDPVELLARPPADATDMASFASLAQVARTWVDVVIDGIRSGVLLQHDLQVRWMS